MVSLLAAKISKYEARGLMERIHDRILWPEYSSDLKKVNQSDLASLIRFRKELKREEEATDSAYWAIASLKMEISNKKRRLSLLLELKELMVSFGS